MPRAKCWLQRRLTMTRGVSGFSRLAIQLAMTVRRPLEEITGLPLKSTENFSSDNVGTMDSLDEQRTSTNRGRTSLPGVRALPRTKIWDFGGESLFSATASVCPPD